MKICLVKTSACNFYDGVNQQEVEDYYASIKDADDPEPISYGLNSTLVKRNGQITEDKWYAEGKYGETIKHIIYWLHKAMDVAENDDQRTYIASLIRYYETGDLRLFNIYCIQCRFICRAHCGIYGYGNCVHDIYVCRTKHIS